jgi:polysaccharide deacetylase family protein (PEP-CTERM system associated)
VRAPSIVDERRESTIPRAAAEEVVNAMSVDVEDYFHVSVFDGIVPRHLWNGMESRVVPNTMRLLDMFDEFKVRSTFFVLGWVAERHPDLLRRIADKGHEIASHGYAHRLIYDQTQESFREDVRRAKRVLEDSAGQRVVGYRAPSYSITPRSLWAVDVLIEEGYEYDASIFPIRHDRYGISVSARHAYAIPRRAGVLVEVPGSTTRIVSMNLPIAGGGYFRILPYWWTRWGIRRVNHLEGRAVVFYLHPWEIDPRQPRLKTGLVGRFRHYRNLEHTELRLRQLLADFRFETVERVVATVNRSAQPKEEYVLPYAW